MYKQVAAFAAVASLVNASPLERRQVANVTSAISSVVSSAVSSASGLPANATSAVANATSAIASATGTESAVAPTATGNATVGNETFPAYPCPAGFLLTYTAQNVTLPVPLAQVRDLFGNWSTSPIFPNVTNANGSGVGSSRDLNVGGAVLSEELVDFSDDQASAIYTWNLTNGPVEAMGVSISNYSTVLSLYDPSFNSTGELGNSTTALTFTNFCSSSQPEGIALVSALAGLELGALGQLVSGGGAAPAPDATSAAPAGSSSAPASTGASSAPSGPVANVTSSAAAVTSSAAAVTSSVASEISSAVSSVVNATTAA